MKRDQVYELREKVNMRKMKSDWFNAINDFCESLFYTLEIRGELLTDEECANITNYLAYRVGGYTKGYDGQ